MKIRRIYEKIFAIMALIIVIILLNTSKVCAKIDTSFNIDMNYAKEAETIGNGLLGTIQVIGTFASVIALMIIGIKYMLGSAEEKSEQKQSLMYYVIGAILVFSITNIVPIIYDIATDVFSEETTEVVEEEGKYEEKSDNMYISNNDYDHFKFL